MIPPPSSYVLQAIRGPVASRSWTISADRIFIGRDPEACQILLPRTTTSVSRIHASVRWSAVARGVLLCDEGSKNGTFIRGRGRIPEDVDELLTVGAELWFGNEQVAFVLVCEERNANG